MLKIILGIGTILIILGEFQAIYQSIKKYKFNYGLAIIAIGVLCILYASIKIV